MDFQKLNELTTQGSNFLSRIKLTSKWVNQLYGFDGIRAKPLGCVAAGNFALLSIFASLISLSAVFWALGINLTNLQQSPSQDNEPGDLIAGYIGHARFLVTHAIFPHFELTRESATLTASMALSVVAAIILASAAAAKKSARAKFHERFEFSLYIIGATLLQYIFINCVICAVVVILRAFVPRDWIRSYTLGVMYSCLFISFGYLTICFFCSRRARILGETSTKVDYEIPCFASILLAMSISSIFLWMASTFAALYPPAISIQTSDACGSRYPGPCTVYVRHQHLPGIVLLDTVDFHLSLAEVDATGKDVAAPRREASGTIRISSSKDDPTPLKVNDEPEAHGALQFANVDCHPSQSESSRRKYRIADAKASAYVRLKDSVNSDEHIEINVLAKRAVPLFLFRSAERNCDFFP